MKTFIATIAALMTLVAAPAFAEEPKAEPKADSKLGQGSNVPCPGGSGLQAVGDKGDGKTTVDAKGTGAKAEAAK